MKKLTMNEVWDFLLEHEFFTQQELELVTSVCGYTLEALNSCIYSRYSYHTLEQWLECEDLGVTLEDLLERREEVRDEED